MTFDPDAFREYLTIDRANLDRDIMRQPSLFYEVGEAYAKAAAVRDTLEEKLATLDAQLYNKYRRDFEVAEEKVTEGMLKNAVATDAKHIKAAEDFNRASGNAAALLALKDAFNQRSYMLRDMVALYVANYFEKDSIRATGKVDNFRNERNRERINDVRTRRSTRE